MVAVSAIMNERVGIQLRQAGWFPGRHVDPAAAIMALRPEGYNIWPELISLLEEFAGLEISSELDDRSIWFTRKEQR
jgi:hypothetical protein